jgi:MoaA/NifB/PqqE/SkfB family radical SAM enzyme
MISFAAKQQYSFIEIFTNATHLDSRLLEIFIQYRTHIAVSFYSDDPEIHDSITKRRGSFGQTVKNLQRMVSADLPLRAGIIEMQENFGHAERAKRFLTNLGICDIKVDSRRGVGRGITTLVPPDPMAELCGECWKGKLCIDSFGKIYPCVFSRFADLGTTNDGIKDILDSNPLITFRTNFKKYCDDREAKRKLHSAPIELHQDTCGPTCSPCNPDTFIDCSPGGVSRCSPNCGPSSSFCEPSAGPCGPDRCNPACGPSRHCGPSDR